VNAADVERFWGGYRLGSKHAIVIAGALYEIATYTRQPRVRVKKGRGQRRSRRNRR
jgi:hypothetical protein